jgi:hypothetical protein
LADFPQEAKKGQVLPTSLKGQHTCHEKDNHLFINGIPSAGDLVTFVFKILAILFLAIYPVTS